MGIPPEDMVPTPKLRCYWPGCPSKFDDDAVGRTYRNRHVRKAHKLDRVRLFQLEALRLAIAEKLSKPKVKRRGIVPPIGLLRKKERQGKGYYARGKRTGDIPAPFAVDRTPGTPVPAGLPKNGQLRIRIKGKEGDGRFVGRIVDGLFFKPPAVHRGGKGPR